METDNNMTGNSLQQWGEATFSDSDRILKGHEFRHMKKEGRTTVGRLLVLSHAPAPDDRRRLGIIVTKKFHKRAVKRNRAYRIVREAYRHLKAGLPEKTWMVIIARKHLLDKNAKDVQDELIELLNREKLLETSRQSEANSD